MRIRPRSRHAVVPQPPIDFLVVGAQKGGTTTLRHYLRRHPDIGLHARDEPHFFDDEAVFRTGPADYAQYHAGFPPPEERLRRGEVTPIYMYWGPSIGRIREYNPDIRLIALLRDPIERAFSGWAMERKRRAEPLSFYDAIMAEARSPRTSPGVRVRSYVDRGRYATQLRTILEHFDRSQLLVIRSEDLWNHPQPRLREVFAFLDLDTTIARDIDPVRLHSGAHTDTIDERSRAYLRDVFDEEVRELEELLDWDLEHWLK